jgi:hypothetical protein
MTGAMNMARTVWVAEGRDESGAWVALPGYAATSAKDVMERVVMASRAEGIDVESVQARLDELGWRIVPYQPMAGWD